MGMAETKLEAQARMLDELEHRAEEGKLTVVEVVHYETAIAVLSALASGELNAQQAARELDRLDRAGVIAAEWDRRDRRKRIARIRKVERSRARFARSASRYSSRPVRPTGGSTRTVLHHSREELLDDLASGVVSPEEADELWDLDYEPQERSKGAQGKAVGTPRTEWVRDDENRYYRPIGIVSGVTEELPNAQDKRWIRAGVALAVDNRWWADWMGR